MSLPPATARPADRPSIRARARSSCSSTATGRRPAGRPPSDTSSGGGATTSSGRGALLRRDRETDRAASRIDHDDTPGKRVGHHDGEGGPGTADGVVVATGGAATVGAASVGWALRPLISSNAARPAAAITATNRERLARRACPRRPRDRTRSDRAARARGGRSSRPRPPNTVCSSSGAATSSWSYVHDSARGRAATAELTWRGGSGAAAAGRTCTSATRSARSGSHDMSFSAFHRLAAAGHARRRPRAPSAVGPVLATDGPRARSSR